MTPELRHQRAVVTRVNRLVEDRAAKLLLKDDIVLVVHERGRWRGATVVEEE